MHLTHNILLLLSLYVWTAESAYRWAYLCNDATKTNGDSKISRNIGHLLPKLASGTAQNGFMATSFGRGRARIFGLAQCRGDASINGCNSCIQDAAEEIRNLCPDQSDARIWYDLCFLRYNHVKFFGEIDTSGTYFYNVENVTDADVFNQKLGDLMDQISSEAVEPDHKGLGKGKSDISPSLTLYALVQCTRDLSEENCVLCLDMARGNFTTYCDNKKGCRVLYSSCYAQYETFPFYA